MPIFGTDEKGEYEIDDNGNYLYYPALKPSSVVRLKWGDDVGKYLTRNEKGEIEFKDLETVPKE